MLLTGWKYVRVCSVFAYLLYLYIAHLWFVFREAFSPKQYTTSAVVHSGRRKKNCTWLSCLRRNEFICFGFSGFTFSYIHSLIQLHVFVYVYCVNAVFCGPKTKSHLINLIFGSLKFQFHSPSHPICVRQCVCTIEIYIIFISSFVRICSETNEYRCENKLARRQRRQQQQQELVACCISFYCIYLLQINSYQFITNVCSFACLLAIAHSAIQCTQKFSCFALNRIFIWFRINRIVRSLKTYTTEWVSNMNLLCNGIC